MVNQCFNCKFWRFTNDKFGECHRFPPSTGQRFSSKWPEVSAIEWCGEHQKTQPKEKHNGKVD